MNKHRKGSRFMLLAAVMLVLGMLLGACGVDGPTGGTSQTKSGVVTVGTATAGLKACTACHTVQTAVWMKSKHANVYPNGNLYSQGIPTYGQIYTNGVFTDPVTTPAFCKNCHDPQGDSGQLIVSYTGNTLRPVIGCEACHSGGQAHASAGGSEPIGNAFYTAGVISGTTSSLQVSSQFLTCAFQCHQLLDPNDPVNTTATVTHGPLSTVSPTGTNYTITDTHFAPVTGTYGTSTQPVKGYALTFNSEKVCSECHDPHGTADIPREWAQSPFNDLAGDHAWARFNWTLNANWFCQRCHTTTGFTNYANANASGDTATKNAIWNGAVSNFTDTNWRPQMLMCRGCHTDNRGTVRNPGPYDAIYGYRPTGTVIYVYSSHQYPDIASSNVCVPCHTGRNQGKTIKLLQTKGTNTTTPIDFSNLAASTVHDFAAAGTMFRGVGYEFEDRDYSDPPTYTHNKVGTSAVPGTGTSGPCVGCHMYRSDGSSNHVFRNIYTYGVSSFITTTTTVVSSQVCFRCHAGSSAQLGEVVENENLAFQDAIAALTYFTTPPLRWPSATNWLAPGDTDTSGNTTGKNNMGASTNRRYLTAEGGAFVHNSKYTKRLLYDSIDWVDNYSLDYSTGSTLNALCSSGTQTTWCARGIPYLLSNGVNTNSPSERPY